MPHEPYGKFTWRLENFSDISKRELRSSVFEVGSYKWCVFQSPRKGPHHQRVAIRCVKVCVCYMRDMWHNHQHCGWQILTHDTTKHCSFLMPMTRDVSDTDCHQHRKALHEDEFVCNINTPASCDVGDCQ